MPKGIYERNDSDWVLAGQSEGRIKSKLLKEYEALEKKRKIRVENDRLRLKNDSDFLRHENAELKKELSNREDELGFFKWIKKYNPNFAFPETIYREQKTCGK
mgnify:CR=1 FL=1